MELISNGLTQADYDRIDEADKIMDDLRKLVPKLKVHFLKMNGAAERVEQEIDRFDCVTGGSVSDVADTDRCFEIASDFFSACISAMEAASFLLTNSEARKNLINTLPDYKDAFMEAIQIKVESGVLYVKMPPVSCSCNHFIFTAKGAVPANYSRFFRDEIMRQMLEKQDDIPDFGPRNINLLAVYDGSSTKIPDTLNLDIKTAVDAITDSMTGQDGWYFCSFSLSSIIDKDLDPGLYFTVTNGFAEAPDHHKNIENLKRIFPEKFVRIASDD